MHTIGPLLGALVLLHSPPLIFLGLALRWEQPVFIFAPPISCEGHGKLHRAALSARLPRSACHSRHSCGAYLCSRGLPHLRYRSSAEAPKLTTVAATTSSAPMAAMDNIAGAASLGVWLALVLLWDSLVVMLAALASATGTKSPTRAASTG